MSKGCYTVSNTDANTCESPSRSFGQHLPIQSYPGYPYLSYPKPRLSERSSERGVSLKKNGILTKIADSVTEQSTRVCVSYVHVQ